MADEPAEIGGALAGIGEAAECQLRRGIAEARGAAAEEIAQGFDDIGVVVQEERAAGMVEQHIPVEYEAHEDFSDLGRRMTNSVKIPGSDCSVMVPPKLVTTRRQNARPRPAPPSRPE